MVSNSVGRIVGSGEGPSWDMAVGRPAIFKLLSEQTGGRIAVFEEIVPPTVGTPLHIHHNADEVIYIHSGEFSVRLGETTGTASTGSWIFIPLGSVHGWRNSGPADGRVFFIFTPGAGGLAFEEMRHQGIPLRDIDPKVSAEIFERNGYEFITSEWE